MRTSGRITPSSANTSTLWSRSASLPSFNWDSNTCLLLLASRSLSSCLSRLTPLTMVDPRGRRQLDGRRTDDDERYADGAPLVALTSSASCASVTDPHAGWNSSGTSRPGIKTRRTGPSAPSSESSSCQKKGCGSSVRTAGALMSVHTFPISYTVVLGPGSSKSISSSSRGWARAGSSIRRPFSYSSDHFLISPLEYPVSRSMSAHFLLPACLNIITACFWAAVGVLAAFFVGRLLSDTTVTGGCCSWAGLPTVASKSSSSARVSYNLPLLYASAHVAMVFLVYPVSFSISDQRSPLSSRNLTTASFWSVDGAGKSALVGSPRDGWPSVSSSSAPSSPPSSYP
mmetsp:Transcript_45541/g.113088  ORF Transcript_45541/g.113088 Transcript_45541/m.113088 type:complete len:343 (+) Transcript_45541:1024-2052(+)